MKQLPCPFCGSDKVKIQINTTWRGDMKASGRCNKCHTRGPIVSTPIPMTELSVEERTSTRQRITEEAIKIWNSRV